MRRVISPRRAPAAARLPVPFLRLKVHGLDFPFALGGVGSKIEQDPLGLEPRGGVGDFRMADQGDKLGGGRVSSLLGAGSAIALLKLKIFDLVHLPERLGRRIEARLETLGKTLLRRRAG